ncbi:MAG: hypothetical protein QG604_372 [Candidatus Dependentiae bacterium]|nr:hypothetical protein [Candidatus Dependentiae bacterium]
MKNRFITVLFMCSLFFAPPYGLQAIIVDSDPAFALDPSAPSDATPAQTALYTTLYPLLAPKLVLTSSVENNARTILNFYQTLSSALCADIRFFYNLYNTGLDQRTSSTSAATAELDKTGLERFRKHLSSRFDDIKMIPGSSLPGSLALPLNLFKKLINSTVTSLYGRSVSLPVQDTIAISDTPPPYAQAQQALLDFSSYVAVPRPDPIPGTAGSWSDGTTQKYNWATLATKLTNASKAIATPSITNISGYTGSDAQSLSSLVNSIVVYMNATMTFYKALRKDIGTGTLTNEPDCATYNTAIDKFNAAIATLNASITTYNSTKNPAPAIATVQTQMQHIP